MEERGFSFEAPEGEPRKSDEVFYNREMLENRDLSKAAAKVFLSDRDDARIADPLAATGIRGLRYSELGDVWFNDANPHATKKIEKALKQNDVTGEISEEDANVFLSRHRNFFHFIDVDPFGSFTNFLDSTARAANHDSMVGLTATDNSATTGSYPTVCERRYGSKPLKNGFKHETSVRILIKEAFQNFSRYDKAFDPKLCFQHRHYARVIGRVTESKKRCNRMLDNIGFLSYCDECGWRKLEERDRCPVCGGEVENAGPLWTGKISDSRFTEKMLQEMPEAWESLRDILELVHGESEILTPFYDLHELASKTGVSAPRRDETIKALKEKGYPASRTHFSPRGLRTDAPIEDLKDLIVEMSD